MIGHTAARLAILIATLLLLNACATAPPKQEQGFEANQRHLAAVSRWRVDGKIGLQQNNQGNSALFSWQQDDDRYSLRLSGPLGIGTVYIAGDAHSVRLRNKDGDYNATSAEALIQQMTGWRIPVTELKYWARGMPAPTLTIEQKQVEDGLLSMLQQGGWSIKYAGYTQIDDYTLPAKIIMTRPEARLTLIYRNWQLL